MSAIVLSGDSRLEKLAQVLNHIWKTEKDNKQMPFSKFLDDGQVTEESVNVAISDSKFPQEIKEMMKEIKDNHPAITWTLVEVMKEINPEIRPSTTVSGIVTNIDRQLHPGRYIRFHKKIYLKDNENALFDALAEIWTDEKMNDRVPFDRFLHNTEVTKKSIDAALSDYPEIGEDMKAVLTEVMVDISIESRKDPNILNSIIKSVVYKLHPSLGFTRFEDARIIGARALQISYGAPVLVDYPDGQDDPTDPIDVAFIEYERELIPITVVRNGTN